MRRHILFLLTLPLFCACGGISGGSGTHASSESQEVENCNGAQKRGYNNGYEDGYDDGYGWRQHGVSYNDMSSFQTDDGQRAYTNGYKNVITKDMHMVNLNRKQKGRGLD